MNKYIFDVDGVLCDRGQPINEEFKWFFEEWTEDKKYYLATGSNHPKTIAQIGHHIVSESDISFHCLGNSIFPDHGHEICVNRFHFSKEEEAFLYKFWATSKYSAKASFESVVEKRNGSVNYSLAVRGGTVEERQHYIKHDSLYRERENFVIQLANTFPRFDAYIGGSCSIDIVLRGANKSQVLNFINTDDEEDHIYFFCDQYGKYGIDTPLIDAMEHIYKGERTVIKIAGGYKQTLEILKKL
jgi:hydroxymethylpyrimidine pyrophosphatase-like HAD family hydrolase